jgi:hypothetical protein
MTSSPTKKAFFDLHIIGFGYLNRIREVTPARATPFLSCDISAIHGPVEKAEYLRFDAKVSGKDAKRLVRRCKDSVDAGSKVLLGFKLGDPWIDIFTYSKGEKKGQTGASLKARLLFISWIKIDGDEVYRASAADAEAPKDVPAQSAGSNSDPELSSDRDEAAEEAQEAESA